ncbi:MAG: hypothetical protein DKT66_10235 [Candidatus Melainabacteria bacterium]|nr:MAG: hypothetical protein DKT66_10235 [Candidatus Melainabacteria bacterium]
MNLNEEFAEKLACPKCSRPAKNKSRWFRFHKRGNETHFYYRCAKCYSEFQGVVSDELLAKLRQRGISAELTKPSSTLRQSRNELSWFSLPTFGKKRRELQDMKRYQMSFEHELWSDGNDYLSHVVTKEGKNWKS